MSPLAQIGATILTAAASGIAANKTEIESTLGVVNVDVVGDVEALAKNPHIPPLISVALTEGLAVLGPEAESVMSTYEGDGVDKLVALLNAASAKLQAS